MEGNWDQAYFTQCNSIRYASGMPSKANVRWPRRVITLNRFFFRLTDFCITDFYPNGFCITDFFPNGRSGLVSRVIFCLTERATIRNDSYRDCSVIARAMDLSCEAATAWLSKHGCKLAECMIKGEAYREVRYNNLVVKRWTRLFYPLGHPPVVRQSAIPGG